MAMIGAPVSADPAPPVTEFHAGQSASPGLRGSMVGGNTVGDQIREAQPRADGYRHIDTPRLIRRLQELNVNFYVFQVWSSPTDWEDLRNEFAPAAQQAGIKIMPYLVPPTECWYFGPDGKPFPRLVDRGKCSAPYYLDYVAWAKAIAELSLQYPVVVGWAIDDFNISGNAAKFTPEYMQEITAAQNAINPEIGLWTTVYYSAATNDAFLAKYAPYIEGVIYAYHEWGSNTQDASYAHQVLDTVLAHTEPLGLRVIFLTYVGRYLNAMITPTAEYVTELMRAVRPYVDSGRVEGILAYGTPSGELAEPNNTYRAASGAGRLSLSIGPAKTSTGHFAAASQRVRVEPDRSTYTITFSEQDQWPLVPNLIFGYHRKQLLVDGAVVWESDVVDGNFLDIRTHTVDVTNAVQGKQEVEVTFRLLETRGVGNYPVDVTIDDVSAQGLVVRNGGFEDRSEWTLTKGGDNVLPLIDLWSEYRPIEATAAVGRVFAEMAGAQEHPTHPTHPAKAPKNPRAMYGAGRLSLSVAHGATTSAGECASATQQVKVTPGLPRYELSFWQSDQWTNTPLAVGVHSKRVLIDGESLYTVDVSDGPANTYIQGQVLKGPVDVTELVSGKSQITLTIMLCETKDAVGVPVDVGFDHIESIGLHIRNPGFEHPTDWLLSSQGNVRAVFDITH